MLGSPSLALCHIVLRQEEKEKKRKGGGERKERKEGKKENMVQFSKITDTKMRGSIKGDALVGSGV